MQITIPLPGLLAIALVILLVVRRPAAWTSLRPRGRSSSRVTMRE